MRWVTDNVEIQSRKSFSFEMSFCESVKVRTFSLSCRSENDSYQQHEPIGDFKHSRLPLDSFQKACCEEP